MSVTDDRVAEFEGLGPAAKAALLVSAFLGLAAGYSSTYFYSSGLFILPVAQDLGLSRGQASIGPLVCSLGAALTLPAFGRLLDRIGAVPIAIVSLLGLATGFAIMATLASDFASYLVCSFVIALLGSASTALPYSRLVIGAFARRRGIAIGVMLTGTGIGAFCLPLFLLPYIAAAGWRAAYGMLGVCVLLAALVVAALLLPIRSSLAIVPRTPSLHRPAGSFLAVAASRPFILLGGAFFALAISTVGIVVHFVPMLVDAGLSKPAAGSLAANIGLASLIARLSIGWLLDRYRPESITFAVIALLFLGLGSLLTGGAAMALPAALIVGLVIGAEVDLLAFFTTRLFGRDQYGIAYSSLFSLYLVGGALGPAGIGYLVDFTGSYKAALVFSIAILVGAGACVSRIRSLPTISTS